MSDEDEYRRALEAAAMSPAGKALFGAISGKPVQDGAQAVFLPEEAAIDTSLPALTAGHFRGACKPGHGPKTCRYCVHGLDGIACAKSIPAIRAEIDRRAPTMRAKGDNCGGRSGYIPADTSPR